MFRLPALSHGVTSFLWALVFASFVYFGSLSIAVADASALVLAVVVGAGSFLFIRTHGEDTPHN